MACRCRRCARAPTAEKGRRGRTSGTLRFVTDPADRRKYLRLKAPVFCRPTGRPFFARRQANDISLGGVRVYADEAPTPGDRLELELFLPDESALECTVEVVWVEPLPEGSPARFDVGARFVKLDEPDRSRLAAVLQQPD